MPAVGYGYVRRLKVKSVPAGREPPEQVSVSYGLGFEPFGSCDGQRYLTMVRGVDPLGGTTTLIESTAVAAESLRGSPFIRSNLAWQASSAGSKKLQLPVAVLRSGGGEGVRSRVVCRMGV